MCKRLCALLCAFLLLSALLSFSVSALRIYDVCTGDFLRFAKAVGENSGDIRSEIIVKSSNRPDFRFLHPQYTVEGPDHTYVVRFSDAAEAEESLAALRRLSGVAFAECNDYVTVQDSSVRTAAKNRSWGIRYMHSDVLADWIYQNRPNATALVAIVDSGITATHEMFQGRIHSGVSYLKTAYTKDESGHGTAVAGIIADVTKGLNVRLMIVKSINEKNVGSLVNVTAGIKYAASHGADIVNLSFVSEHCYASLHDAIRYAQNCGCLPIISAGNYGVNMDKKICCPAHMQEPIVVSGCTNLGLPYFNNCYGSSIDLCAPGSNVVTAAKNGRYSRVSGTSFAAPHVAAVAAMYKLCYPDAGVRRLKELLTENTKDHGWIGFDKQYGWGVPAPNKLPLLSTGASPAACLLAR